MLKDLELKAVEINRKNKFQVNILHLSNAVEFVISSKHLEIDTTVGHDYMNNPTYKDNLRVARVDFNEPYYNSSVNIGTIQLRDEIEEISKLQSELLNILTTKKEVK